MKVADMQFDEGQMSQVFKLADGHDYAVHKMEREGKGTVYALLSPHGAFTPYVTEHQMDKVIALRLSPSRRVDAVPDEISHTGFTCPGCGAVVTESGSHVGEPPKAKEAVTELPASSKPRSRFFK